MAILDESVMDFKNNFVFVTLDDSHSSVASLNSPEIVFRPSSSHFNAKQSKTEDSGLSSPVSNKKSVIILNLNFEMQN